MAASKKTRIVMDKAGITAVLKSQDVENAMMSLAKDLAKDFNEIDPEGDWEAKRHERPSRTTIVVKTDSVAAKWREVASGAVAKKIRSMTKKGRARLR